MDFPGYAIGGLSVGEPRELTREMIEATLPLLPADKPRYVMGVGYPEEIVEYAAMGVDMMDCVLPTRAARHGLLFTSEGRLNIKNRRFAEDQGPLDPECGCMVCARYSRAYLRHLFVTQELLGAVLNTLHNLAFYLDTMESVRDAIQLGVLPALLARVRARNERTPQPASPDRIGLCRKQQADGSSGFPGVFRGDWRPPPSLERLPSPLQLGAIDQPMCHCACTRWISSGPSAGTNDLMNGRVRLCG